MTEYATFISEGQIVCIYQTEDAAAEKDLVVDFPCPVGGAIIGDLYKGTLGGLFTHFLRADLSSEDGLKKLEAEWKYPTWYKLDGNPHNRGKINSLLSMLLHEQSHMKRATNLCLEVANEDGGLDTEGRLFGYSPNYGYHGLTAIERFHLHYYDTNIDNLISSRLALIKLNLSSVWKKGLNKELRQIGKIRAIKLDIEKKLIELREATDNKNSRAIKLIEKQIQNFEADLTHQSAKGYESLWKHISNDILALCWLDLMKCIEHDKHVKKCANCYNYFIFKGIKGPQYGPCCPKHKRRAKTLLEKERDKMYMRYYRSNHPSSITLEEYNAWLKANGFSEHSPLKKRKGRSQ